jgi:hypothetical protein
MNIQEIDVIGREVATLAHNEKSSRGYHAVLFDAENLPSGECFYRLWAGNFAETKKMMLIK